MTEDIDQLRTELLNVMAEAGRLALKFDPLSAAAFAPFPNTAPQQYVVAGTLPTIAKVLPAESAAHLAGQSQATRAVPEGWKLVPVEPTEEMIQAACLNQASLDTYPNYEAWWDSHSSGISEKIRGYVSSDYRAMIAAAPTAQEVTQQATPTAPAEGNVGWAHDLQKRLMVADDQGDDDLHNLLGEVACCLAALTGRPDTPLTPAPVTQQAAPTSEQNARFAIDAAIQYGRENRNQPPSTDHWLYEYWNIGRQLASFGETGWDNVTPIPPATQQAEPECAMCNDNGIVGYPPDQYEECPDCIGARTVTQQAAKAETAEQAEGEQANVLPPTRGTDSQQEASERALFEKWAADQYENLGGEFAGPGKMGWWYWSDETADAWEGWLGRAELAGRCRAQGGSTSKENSSDLAPTTSTVSAPGGLVPVGTLSVYEDKEATFGHAYDISTNMDGHKLLQTLDGAELYALRTTSGKGEAA